MAKLFLEQNISFVRESTLTSQFDFKLMEEAKNKGYFVRLVYISLASAELALSRVGSRVSKGGHNVPPEDVVRRYHRSKQNLPRAAALADSVTVLDNSERQYAVTTLEEVMNAYARNNISE